MAKVISIEEHLRKTKRDPARLQRTIHFHALPWEDPAEIDAMIAHLERQFPPQNFPERSMLDHLLHSAWRLHRLERLRAPELASERRRLGLNSKSLEQTIGLAKRSYASSLRSLKLLRSMTKEDRKVRR